MAYKHIINRCISSFDGVNHLRDTVISDTEGDSWLQWVLASPAGPLQQVDEERQAICSTWLTCLSFLYISSEATWSRACRSPCGISGVFQPQGYTASVLTHQNAALLHWEFNFKDQCQVLNRLSQPTTSLAVPMQCMHKVYLLIYFVWGSLKQECYLGLSCGIPQEN